MKYSPTCHPPKAARAWILQIKSGSNNRPGSASSNHHLAACPWNPQVMRDSNHPESASLNHHGSVLLRTVYLLIHRPHVQHVVFGHGRNHPCIIRVPANVTDARKVPTRVEGLKFRVWWLECKVLCPGYSPSMDEHELWGTFPRRFFALFLPDARIVPHHSPLVSPSRHENLFCFTVLDLLASMAQDFRKNISPQSRRGPEFMVPISGQVGRHCRPC